MRLEEVQNVIKDNMPKILNIGDYEDRVKKCIDILKNTHLENDIYYTKQESDDVVEMLDTFLVENEAYGYMKEHNYDAFHEANQILDICKMCTFENKYWRTIPLSHTCYAWEGTKISMLDIRIGDNKQDLFEALDAYDLLYESKSDDKCIKVVNKLVGCIDSVKFELLIFLDNDMVSSFLITSNISSRKWDALAVIDDFFSRCSYKLVKCSKESIVQIYSSFYDIAEVIQNAYSTEIRITTSKQYEKDHKSWWKI